MEKTKGGLILLMISCDVQTSLRGFAYPITIKNPVFSKLSDSVHDLNVDSSRPDLDDMRGHMRDMVSSASIIYPAIGEFVEFDV